ncbi:MAG: carboxypeptidase-like regulatory domain-containing protein [Thermoproteota archaeon]
MNIQRGKLNGLVLLLTMLLISANHSLSVFGDSEVKVPLYKSPNVNGIISTGEYLTSQLNFSWVKLYAVHDASKLFIGIVLQNTSMGIDLLFNMGNLNATTLTVATTRYSVNRSGILKYYYGQGDKWIEAPVDNVSLKVINGTTSWTIEISMPLSRLDVFPNTERTVGFALMISGKFSNYSWPGNALFNNPSTWGIISSPDNWATRNDIGLEIALTQKSLIVGSNVTLVLIIINDGDAPVPDYWIKIVLDNVLIENATAKQLELKTPLEKEDRIVYEKKIVNVTEGTHKIKVNITGLGISYESDYDNNLKNESFTARYATIEVLGKPGITVELEGENQTISSEGNIAFYSSIGSKRIRVQEIYSPPSQGFRYVFIRWKHGDSFVQTPELVVDVQGDLRLTVEHREECLVNLSFIDSDNAPLTPSSYACIFPNATSYNGILTGLWTISGDLKVINVSYSGVNVLDEVKIYSIYGPKEIRIPCRVVSGSVRILDPLSMPIQGAELTAVFLNNTRAKYVTGSDGRADFNRVPGGKLRLTISNLGYSNTVEIDFSAEREITIRIPMSLNIVLIILAVMITMVAIVVFKVFWKREKPAPKRSGEYEFEEL